jgi:hypothetical protein
VNIKQAKKYVKENMEAVALEEAEPYCVRVIEVKYGDTTIHAAGHSICSPEDCWNVAEGNGIAWSRAITSAAQQIVQLEANMKRKEKMEKEKMAVATAVSELMERFPGWVIVL